MKALKLTLAVLALAACAFGQQPFNEVSIAGTAIATGNGTASAGTQRMTIASDNTPFQIKLLGNGGAALDVAIGGATAAANALQVGAVFNSSAPTLTNGQGAALQLDASGNLKIVCSGCSAASTVSLNPATSGGLTLAHTVLAASTNATSLKASQGQVYSFCLNNNAAYPVFLKLYNKASAPTVGTDTPVSVLEAQAGVPICKQTEEGFAFATGIAWAATKGLTDADATAVLASDGTVEIAYK
jgi:hypothetical protein